MVSTDDVRATRIFPSHLSGRDMAVLVALCAAAYAGNYFAVPLFGGVDLLLGGVAVMLTALRRSLFETLVVALVGSLHTLVLWGHPYGLIIFVAEAAFVQLLHGRWQREATGYDALFWLLIGAPLVWVFYSVVMGIEAAGWGLVALKQPINGILYTALASIVHHSLLLRARKTASLPRRPRFADVLAPLFLVFLLLPTLAVVSVHTQFQHSQILARVADRLHAAVRQVTPDEFRTPPDAAALADLRKRIRPASSESAAVALVDTTGAVVAERPEGWLSTRPRTVDVQVGLVERYATDAGSTMEREHDAYLVHGFDEPNMAVPGDLRAVFGVPSAPYIDDLRALQLAALALMALIAIGGVLGAGVVAHRTARLLEPLIARVRKVPAAVTQAQPPEWPQSPIRELAALTRDIADVEGKLARHIDELAESENRIRTIATNLPGGVYQRRMEPDGRVYFTYLSPTYGAAFGIDQNIMLSGSDPVSQLIHPEDRAGYLAGLQRSAETGLAHDLAFRVATSDGHTRWIRSLGQPRQEADGAIVWEGIALDETARKTAEIEIERLNEHLRSTLDSITDGFYTLDREWRFTDVNTETERVTGWPREELLGQNLWEAFPEVVGTPIEREYRRAMSEGVSVAVEQYVATLKAWVDIRAIPSAEGLTVFFTDVTERHAMLERLETQQQELRTSLADRQRLINTLPAHIALLDPTGQVLDVNEPWRKYGRDNDNTDVSFGVGSNYLAVCEAAGGDHSGEAPQVLEGLRAVLRGERQSVTIEYPCHEPDQKRWFRMTANRLASGTASAGTSDTVVTHVDITERKLSEQKLNRLAYEDALTGACSRNGLVERLNETVTANGWQAGAMVVMLDLHQQSDVNSAHGYTAGDELLQQVARRLEEHAGEGAIIARIGGDEFAVFLPERADRDLVQQRRTIARVFQHPFALGDSRVEVGATFGYTALGPDERDPEALIREAELALFQSRASDHPDAWTAYSSTLQEQALERVQITRELRQALAKHEFQLHFQPKVDLRNGELVSSEALIRWMHPEHGLVSPGYFIDIAERSQLIGPIGDWVLDDACRCLAEWQAAGLGILRVAVNVSLVQFTVGDISTRVREALERHQVAPDGLTLEITESVFERESELLLRQLRSLHDIGVRLSLDDFGTGYSSLLYLQKYPFDEIKIDRGFVDQMLSDGYSQKIVDTVLTLAGALGAEVVAEGIESDKIRSALLDIDCHYGQGYYFSVPLAEEDFRWLLEKRSPLPLLARQTS